MKIDVDELFKPIEKQLNFEITDSELECEEVEQLSKESGVNYGKIIDFCFKKDPDSKPAVKKFIASDGSVDRHGDIVDPKGWQLKSYRKNPIFLWQHNSWEAPIGTSLKEIKHKDSLEMHIMFHRMDDLSERAFKYYDSGVMRTVSVGFKALKIKDIRDEKERQQLGLGRWGNFYEETELLELSAVTIPANKNAVVLNSFNKSLRELEEKLKTHYEFELKELREKIKLFQLKLSDIDDKRNEVDQVDQESLIKLFDGFAIG